MRNDKAIAIKYQVEEEVNTPSVMSIKWTDADDNKNKEECPIFTNGSASEFLIQISETILSIEGIYDWY